jgi:hypothetical protein
LNRETAIQSVSALVNEIEEQFGFYPDTDRAIDEAIKLVAMTGLFANDLLDYLREFYSDVLSKAKTSERNSGFHLSFLGKRKEKRARKHQTPEFILPDKLAIGFCLLLGGALLCLIPSGVSQGVGTGFITGGLTSIIDGVTNGEKPYYIDSETGNRIEDLKN